MPARRCHVLEPAASPLPAAILMHPFDEIEPGDLFGDAVLHLQSRVDFEKVEFIRVRIVDELDRSGGGSISPLLPSSTAQFDQTAL